MQPAPITQAYFISKPITTQKDWNKTRAQAGKILSSPAQLKLEWIISYHTHGKENAKATVTHFGITRKTVHKWIKRFKLDGLKGLEENSRAPITRRRPDISLQQRVRIRTLRKKYPQYGKLRLVELYKKQYKENISSWKIQKVIEEDNLYYDKVKASKLRRKQVQARIHKRKRITTLVKEKKVNYLWHVDTVVLTLSSGGYRYLLTAIDEISKLAFARLYTTHTSRNARDFLERLVYLTNNRVINLHHDNGSEFKKELKRPVYNLQYHNGIPGLIPPKTMQSLNGSTELSRKNSSRSQMLITSMLMSSTDLSLIGLLNTILIDLTKPLTTKLS